MSRARMWLFYLLLLPFTVHLSPFTLAAAETSDRIVALVNNEVITEGDLRAHMSAVLSQEKAGPDLPHPLIGEEMESVVLQRLIEDRLIVQEAKRLGVAVGQDEVVERLRSIKGQFGTKDAYEDMLQEAGLSEEQLKTKLRDQLFAQKAIEQQIRRTIRVSLTEMAQATASASTPAASGPEEWLVWHLLVRRGERRSDKEALALATGLRQQALGGASLDALARQHSEDLHATEGGMLGWVRPGQLLPELNEALARLSADEVSEPVQTALGFHLMKILQRRALDPTQAMSGPQAVERQLYQQKFAKAMKAWLAELHAKAYIEVMNE